MRGDEVGISPTFSAVGLDGPSSVTVALIVTDNSGDPGTLDTFTVTIDWGDPLSPDNIETVARGVERVRVRDVEQNVSENTRVFVLGTSEFPYRHWLI